MRSSILLLLCAAANAQSGAASFTSIGQGCGGTGAPGIFEHFQSANPNDLQGLGLSMLLVGSTYLVLAGAPPFVAPSGGAVPFTDDQTQPIQLPFAFPHATGTTTTLWVCSNGFISLTQTTNASFTPNTAQLFSDPPRFCAFWNDLNPGAGGSVHAQADPLNPQVFVVTWFGVPEFGAGGANTFQIRFEATGQVQMTWSSMSASTGLVGYHPGLGAAGPPATDLSALLVALLGFGTNDLTLGPNGIARPVLGTTFVMTIGGLPTAANFGLLVLGTASLTPPVDLSPIGLENCSQFVRADHTVALFPTGSPTLVSLSLPNDPRFVGAHLFAQAAMWGSPATTLGVVTSNGGDLRLNTF